MASIIEKKFIRAFQEIVSLHGGLGKLAPFTGRLAISSSALHSQTVASITLNLDRPPEISYPMSPFAPRKTTLQPASGKIISGGLP